MWGYQDLLSIHVIAIIICLFSVEGWSWSFGGSGGSKMIMKKGRSIIRHEKKVSVLEMSSSDSVMAPRSSSGIRTSSENMKGLDMLPSFPRTWVPVASTFELDPDRPTPVSFLNQNYVLFCNNAGQWNVLDDSCAHRMAPLSEGRIDRESDVLECAYHGWSFESTGACSRIPQATSAESEKFRCNPKSCVKSYPTMVEKGVVFMWPWTSTPPTTFYNGDVDTSWVLPQSIMKDVNVNSSTYTRDLPYGWDVLLENIVDPSHIPFAHHGLQGTRHDAVPINMTMTSDVTEKGFEFQWEDRTMSMFRKGNAQFKAPFLLNYDAEYKNATRPFKLSVLCIPIKPGWSRAIIFSGGEPSNINNSNLDDESNEQQAVTTDKKQKKTLLGLIFKYLPIWLVHLLSNRFLDSDLAFLHYQEGELEKRRQINDLSLENYNKDYYIPAPSDRSITAVRRWISKYAHLPRPLPPTVPHPQRITLFDHYGQHTSHCVHCLKALENFSKWRRNAKLIAASSILFSRFVWPRVFLLLSLGCVQLLNFGEKSFHSGDFQHYKNN